MCITYTQVNVLLNEIKVNIMTNLHTTTRKWLSLIPFMLCLSAYTLQASADENPAYVDSVHSWGSWDLGLEPAAGGPVIPPKTVINVKTHDMQFRPNDNARFASNAKPMVTAGTNPAPAPVSAPTGPATMTPLAPGVPAPTGGPSLF